MLSLETRSLRTRLARANADVQACRAAAQIIETQDVPELENALERAEREQAHLASRRLWARLLAKAKQPRSSHVGA